MNAYRQVAHRILALAGFVLAAGFTSPTGHAADTTLSNLPLYSASNVPANLMLALSVEFPTGTVAAYTDNAGVALVTGTTSYSCNGKETIKDNDGKNQSFGDCYFPKMNYLGYFDPLKCYKYSSSGYFTPSKTLASSDLSCNGDWSGNMLNWATMTALDEFRKTLTGGNRSVDTATTTVLVRSNLNSQSNEGNFPNKVIGSAYNAKPSDTVGDDASKWSVVYLRSYALGTKFWVSNNPSFASTGAVNKVTNVRLELNAQVSVCEKSAVEDNCTAYGQNYKPEGLIQQNYTRIRVGAAAYANTDGSARPNGVVRALLRDNGPTTYNGNGARQDNTNKEWSAVDGTFIANPASGDSALAKGPDGTAYTQSGVINYLNKFGTNGYETYDTISELYWSALAYFMRAPLSADYTNGLNGGNSLDKAFPVFKGTAANATDSNDPMQYKCAANAILVIGDSHTHCDQRVPSSKGPTGSNNYCQLQSPSAVVNGVDAAKYTTALGKLPMVESDAPGGASKTFEAKIGSSEVGLSYVNSGQLSTYFIAGLAYFAHTNDIRSDLTGKQTVDTYVVDVMEPGAFSGASGQDIYSVDNNGSKGPNQYWLAAKYGGFADTKNDGKPSSFLTWHTNTSTGVNLRPDNYFVGNRPDLIVAGLGSIFSNVSTSTQLSASGPSVSPTRVLSNVVANSSPYNSPASGFPIYTVTYFPGSWSGEVTGTVAAAAVGEDVATAPGANTWSAQTRLDQLGAYTDTSGLVMGWRDNRRVFTRGNSGGTRFQWLLLSSAQQGYLSNDVTVLNFLRGDRSREGSSFHIRAHLLGDIVNSQATLVQGALSTSYNDSNNPGYSAFITAQKNRTPVVYVGANDGMVHAFQADFSTPSNPLGGGGAELWAYVPNLVFAGPNNTPKVDGIAALANLNGATTNGYEHHFYVDQTPQAADVDFDWTVNTEGTAGTKPSTKDWHTVLVGGLGKGGKGFYGLDITSVPAAPTTNAVTEGLAEAAVASKSLWEFTDSTMGYSFARPLITKTRKYGWVVIATSGYNNADGKGYLYVINVKTGKLLEKIATPSGSTANPIGLSRPSGYIKDVSDNTVEQVYVGDLQGNVWRFDLSGTGDYQAPVLLATLKDAKGKGQPITTAPRIELDYDSTGTGTRRWVFVGTGKFLDSSDLTDTQKQTMYALRDGTGLAPNAISTPIVRANLRVNNLIDNLNIQDSDYGWYYDLTGTAPGTGGATERIVVDPDAVAGIFSINWGTLIPTADPCALNGAIYSAAYGSGQSNLLTSGGASVPFLTTNSAITNLQMVQLPDNGKFVLLYGQTGQSPQTANMVQPGNPSLLQRTNWREILD
ncbi:type IV pilus assembly protein PilY1 [Luteibacter sp. UNCMF331Sha3.1]|uniref:pilus assembly protein n=1 Tax=Luteibacter sp. UNCMF331Sha3.1 TaxID=1502760 RepID=UPI0008B061EA|nr:PilC/PilY family type IV pilus protein [Luteibacter sp. UNCMF331Sha3.1]SEM24538.1 type IV pilus assembly protein PilY1 [Luteibacter sp. UNCMF331Sha3.1]